MIRAGVIALFLAWPLFAVADVVVLRDGTRVEGRVLAVDGERVTVRTEQGDRGVARDRVLVIEFGESEEITRPPLKIELRSVAADDAVEVLLEDRVVLSAGREQGAWTDLTSVLKDGNNKLQLRIHNERAGWAYRLSLRINGVATSIACGKPRDASAPCRCCGKSGRETGWIELDPVWLFVDRGTGSAEVLP